MSNYIYISSLPQENFDATISSSSLLGIISDGGSFTNYKSVRAVLTKVPSASFAISSSYCNRSLSSSYSDISAYSTTASYSLNGGSGGASLTTGALYPITSSWSESSSWADLSGVVLKSQPYAPMRVSTDGSIYLYNQDTLLWHELSVQGVTGSVAVVANQTGVEEVP